MRSIYLIRHADSNQNNPSYSDFDRPLSDKGLKDVALVANELANLNFNPQLIICSTSERTVTTAKLIPTCTSYLFDSSVYEASLDYLVALINCFPEKHQEIALVGHNPSISLFANYLTGENNYSMSPCHVVKINLEVDNWSETIQGIGTEIYSISPETLS